MSVVFTKFHKFFWNLRKFELYQKITHLSFLVLGEALISRRSSLRVEKMSPSRLFSFSMKLSDFAFVKFKLWLILFILLLVLLSSRTTRAWMEFFLLALPFEFIREFLPFTTFRIKQVLMKRWNFRSNFMLISLKFTKFTKLFRGKFILALELNLSTIELR